MCAAVTSCCVWKTWPTNRQKRSFPDEVNIGKRISDHAERLGLIVRPIGALNVISPPLILSRAQIDELVEMLGKSIQNTVDDLRKEGLYKS